MRALKLALVIVFFQANMAFCCSPIPYDNGFSFGPNEYIEESTNVVPPLLGNISMFRGGGPCPSNGNVNIEVTLPKDSFFKTGEVGFYFIVLNSNVKDRVFPRHPIRAMKEDDGKYHLIFNWFDRLPKNQPPPGIRFRIVTVLKNGTISDASKIYTIP